MILMIRHNVSDNPLIMPINYNYILQSIIYEKLSFQKEIADFIHNSGFVYDKRAYKAFQFSSIKGHYKVQDHKIQFDEDITWEIRSTDKEIIELIKRRIDAEGICYKNQKYNNIEAVIYESIIPEDNIKIKMQTPICVYSTDKRSGKIKYYSPSEEEFYQLVEDNFKRKYNAFYGVEPDDGIKFQLIKYSDRDKVVTRYKSKIISGWKGIYVLSGDKKYLEFLYDVGLGTRNAQGFGMFSVI